MIRIVGFNYKKISVEKKKDTERGMKINTNIEIKDIKFDKIDVFGDKETANIEYEFKIQYEPGIAKVEFKGSILLLIDEESVVKEIKDSWKEKKVPENVRIGILNMIFSRCNLKALQLEDDLGLPQHLPAPRLGREDNSVNKENNSNNGKGDDKEDVKIEKEGNSKDNEKLEDDKLDDSDEEKEENSKK